VNNINDINDNIINDIYWILLSDCSDFTMSKKNLKSPVGKSQVTLVKKKIKKKIYV